VRRGELQLRRLDELRRTVSESHFSRRTVRGERAASMLEREGLLARVEASITRRDGGPASVAIVGEPGAGKTTLPHAALGDAPSARTLSARCSPLGERIPFGVIYQLFEPIARATPEGASPSLAPARNDASTGTVANTWYMCSSVQSMPDVKSGRATPSSLDSTERKQSKALTMAGAVGPVGSGVGVWIASGDVCGSSPPRLELSRQPDMVVAKPSAASAVTARLIGVFMFSPQRVLGQ